MPHERPELLADSDRGRLEPVLVLTQENVEGKLERVDLHREGKDHAKDPAYIYEGI
jgi:hypothetical protein